mgnify:CR=1 FL=1
MPSIELIECWYNKALTIDEKNRKEFLKASLSDDAELFTAVIRLLEAQDNYDHELTRLREQIETDLENADDELPEIEKYEIKKEIGRGGMAIVYVANRKDDSFEHEVAVKLIKRGMDSEDIVQRFKLEQNVLGRLKHTNIAQIYDAGVSKDGRPYFIMEMVNGQDLITYSINNKLTIKKRLELFLKICSAAAYAHQNLIIHRDIKPSNILVNELGEIKLMDFGIAKLIDPAQSNTHLTSPVRRLLTPDYASPEQLNGDVIDIRSDIFQLGKVLDKLFSDVQTPKEIDLIVSYATRNEANRRYANVQSLMEDIERYLHNKPIIARKSSIGYNLKLFIKRNPVPLAASILILILSVIFINNLNIAKNEAQLKEKKASVTLDFLLSLFEMNDPSISQGDTLSVNYFLKEGQTRASEIADPSIKAAILGTIGEVYSSLGSFKKADQQFNQANLVIPFVDDPETVVDIYIKWANQKYRQSENKEAIALFKKALSNQPTPAQKAAIYVQLSSLYVLFDSDSSNIYKKHALKAAEEMQADRKEQLEINFRLTEIGLDEMPKEKFDSIMALKRNLMSIYEENYEKDKVTLAQMYSNMAVNYRWLNEYDSAKKYARLNLKLLEDIYGKQHIAYAKGLFVLTETFAWIGMLDSAEHYAKRSLAIKKNIFGDNHHSMVDEMSILGKIALSRREAEKAENLLKKSYEISKKAYGLYHKITGDQLFALAQQYNDRKMYDESIKYYPDLVKVDSSTYGLSSNTAATYMDYATALFHLGRYKEALEKVIKANKIYYRHAGTENFLFGL